MKKFILLLLLLALLPGLAYAAPEKRAKKKQGKAAAQETVPNCGYTSAFKVTLAAIGDDHFHALFGNGGKSAETCIQGWGSRLNGSTEPTAAAIQLALANVVGAFSSYPSYKPKLHELIWDRLSGDLATKQPALEQAIDALVTAKFGFTLFNQDAKFHDGALRVEVAQLFTRGRFNSHTWNKIYTDDKYDPKDYIDSDITLYIGLAQEYGVLPVINDDIFGCPPDSVRAETANGYCCCNTAAHGTTYYRKCKGNAPGQNCTPTTGGNCVLGSQNCSAHTTH